MQNTSRPAENLPAAEFAARTKRLNGILRRRKLDALFILTEVNRYYFTGMVASNGVMMAERGEEPLFFTDFRYIISARREIRCMPSKLLWKGTEEKGVLAGFGSGWKRVGFEGAISAERFLKFKEALPEAEWVDVLSDILELRSIKSKAECQALRLACAANDRMLESVLAQVQSGMTEWEISALIRREAELLGQGEAFKAIVCVGSNGAECHHHPDHTVLRNNRLLLTDLGVKLNHYCSDMTRTTFFGKPTELYRKIYKIVLDANRKAIAKIKPGVSCDTIDRVARDYITKAGYGKQFDHGLGHGLGLEVHESPRFSLPDKTLLKPGMVLTVEPGIYLPGRLGIRVEDVILVTRDGCEILSNADRSGIR